MNHQVDMPWLSSEISSELESLAVRSQSKVPLPFLLLHVHMSVPDQNRAHLAHARPRLVRGRVSQLCLIECV